MASSQSPTDRLLKELHLHLAADIRAARLRSLGWFDFRSQDHPEETNAVAMGFAAFLYLSLDETGNWNRAIDVLAAGKAFLDAVTGRESTEREIRELAALLQEKPVRSKAVQDWFDRVYR